MDKFRYTLLIVRMGNKFFPMGKIQKYCELKMIIGDIVNFYDLNKTSFIRWMWDWGKFR